MGKRFISETLQEFLGPKVDSKRFLEPYTLAQTVNCGRLFSVLDDTVYDEINL